MKINIDMDVLYSQYYYYTNINLENIKNYRYAMKYYEDHKNLITYFEIELEKPVMYCDIDENENLDLSFVHNDKTSNIMLFSLQGLSKMMNFKDVA